MVTSEEVLLGLPAEDYADARLVDGEVPPDYVSFVAMSPTADGTPSVDGGGQEEPHVQLLVAARREISCWSSPDCDLAEALSALWPQLEGGYSLIPGRPSAQLQGWRTSFLSIALPSGGDATSPIPGQRRGSFGGGGGATSPFFSSDQFVPLV